MGSNRAILEVEKEMQKPACKLCSQRHWSYEPHTGVTKAVTESSGAAINVTPVTKPTEHSVTKVNIVTETANNVTPVIGNNVTRGRPRIYASNAARQAAYRERR